MSAGNGAAPQLDARDAAHGWPQRRLNTAERDSEGWVVISAALRPWCRVRNGLSEYRRAGVPFVFKDEEGAARFAQRINARSKGAPYKEVKSMTVREFAREAREHAETWREACR
jgi:hypothetical protein